MEPQRDVADGAWAHCGLSLSASRARRNPIASAVATGRFFFPDAM